MSIAEQSSMAKGTKTPKSPSCTHCGLPVPKGLINEDSINQYCCSGCQAAYSLIRASGLDGYYAMAEMAGVGAQLADRDGSKRFDEFDLPSFYEKFGVPTSNSVHEITLVLAGIHCAACIWLIEKLPIMQPGVIDVKLNWARQTARIRWQPETVSLSAIAKTLHRLGYSPDPVRQNDSDVRRQRENRKHLVRIGIAAAAAGNNMLITAALYLGMFSYMSLGMTQLMRVASCVIGLASLLGPGRVFLRGALNSIKSRTPHMDLPIALGLTVGSTVGLVNTIRGTGEIYFDSLSVLILLLLVGRWIQYRQQSRAADSVEMLYRMTPKMTHKIVDGKPVRTFVDLVSQGDLLEIRTGDLIPVDAVVVDGVTEIDEAIISGESCLQRKTTGDTVLAGTQNRGSTIKVTATATGRDTRLSKIVELVEEASLDKPAIVQWANRIGGYFVVSVIGLAVLTLVGWMMIDTTVAVDRTVALLIVACPCALALATPLAVSVAIGHAAKRKIMIKGGDVLQRLNRPGIIWLDKTGTLTSGKLEVAKWIGDAKWQPIVSAMESNSSHPVAEAFVKFADKRDDNSAEPIVVKCFQEQIGFGVAGLVDDIKVLIGNKKLLRSNQIEIPPAWQSIADDLLGQMLSPCWLSADGQVVAIFALRDQLRQDAGAAIEQLKKDGWGIGILSGDDEKVVAQVATRVGIDSDIAFGGMSPEEKVEAVRNSTGNYETVIMVGDGVNDCAALAAASVGIAVHNGAEASLAAAPVYLANEGLAPILTLMEISGSACRTIRTNFAVSVGYNVLGATFASIGLINPLAAAILMPISSLTVVAISLTAGKYKGKDAE